MALRTVYVNHTNGLASPSDAQAQNPAIGYNTWANAEAGEEDDFHTAEISLVIEVVDTITDTIALQIDGSATSPTYDIKIQVSSVARHDGTKGTGAGISANVSTGVVYPRDDNVTIDGLEIFGNASGRGLYFCQFESITNFKFKNNLVYGNSSHGVEKNTNSVIGLDFHDNFIFNNGGTGVYFIDNVSDTGNTYNNTSYHNNTDESGFRGGFRATTTSIIFKNNAAFDNFNDDYYSTTGEGASDEKNASSDATGDTGLINLTTTDQFTDVSTPSDPDLSLKVGSDLIGAGVGPSVDSDVSIISINGETRSGSTTDIGAWLFVGGVVIKTVTDIGSGIDAISQIANTLSILDTGSGVDNFADLNASIPVTEIGSGADIVSPIISLTVSDNGTAVDIISQILNALSVSDILSSNDILSQVLADISVTESGTGVDIVNVLAAVLKTVSDSGSGLDSVLSPIITLSVSDSGIASDSIANILNSLSVQDSGTGVDIASVIQAIIKTVSDSGSGSDVVSITTSLTVADIATALDSIKEISNIFAVSDNAIGTDIAMRVEFGDVGPVKISFTLKVPGVSFDIKQPKIDFTIN